MGPTVGIMLGSGDAGTRQNPLTGETMGIVGELLGDIGDTRIIGRAALPVSAMPAPAVSTPASIINPLMPAAGSNTTRIAAIAAIVIIVLIGGYVLLKK